MENSEKLTQLRTRERILEITVEDLEKDLEKYKNKLKEAKEDIRKELNTQLKTQIQQEQNTPKEAQLLQDLNTTRVLNESPQKVVKKRKRTKNNEEDEKEAYKKKDKENQKKRRKQFQENLLKKVQEQDEMEIEEYQEEVIKEGLAEKYQKGVAHNKEMIKMNRKGIRIWCEYAESFLKDMEEEKKEHHNLGLKTIRTRIYDKMVQIIKGETRESIKKNTVAAEKIYDIFKDDIGRIDKLNITGMSYFTRITKREVLEIKEKVKNVNGKIINRQEKIPLKLQEEKITMSLETMMIDEDIQQEVDGMTNKEVQELINEIGGEIGNISGTTTPLEEGS